MYLEQLSRMEKCEKISLSLERQGADIKLTITYAFILNLRYIWQWSAVITTQTEMELLPSMGD
jgi:hypothetical protein